MYTTIGNEYAIDNNLGRKGIAYYSIYNDEPMRNGALVLAAGNRRKTALWNLTV